MVALGFSIYTIAEVAKDLGIGKETLRKRIRTTNLITHKIGNIEVITGDEVEILKKMEPRVGRPPKKKR